MTTERPFDPDELMRHEAFVRELARRLVYDAQIAEDVAQQTWVDALQAPGRPLHSMRAWLTTIVRRTAHKRIGADRNRSRREEETAANEPAPSAAEIVEREQARAAVVQALLALPKNYRDVVVLRWFEGLPPRAIAKRLNLPVETVRTRHRRAMEQLRNLLDQQTGGDRSAWAAMLLPLIRPSAAPMPLAVPATTASILGGVLLMSTKIKLGAALAVAAAVMLWLSLPPVVPAPVVGEPSDSALTAMVATGSSDSDGTAIVTERTAAPSPAKSSVELDVPVDSATTGTVQVHVAWSDGTSATDVAVIILSRGFKVLDQLTTDKNGIARRVGCAPGSYFTNIMRPDMVWFEPDLQRPRFEVAAGITTEIELVVPESLDITGIVVDGNDRAIANAEVIMQGGYPSMVFARTGDDGRFAIRDVATRCEVGARAPGLAPSPLRRVQGSKGGSVALRLVLDQPGARVAGLVLGPDAQPVARVRVEVGQQSRPLQLRDGSYGLSPPMTVQYTDEHGRFEMPSVTPGTVPIHVVAAGYAPYRDELQLAPGGSASITVHLLPGVTIRGVVRSERGLPIANAKVSASRGTRLSRYAETAGDGSFELVDVAIGEVPIEVRSDAFETLQTTLVAVAGQTLQWNPVLHSPGIVLHGRVLDADGQPVADAQVWASRSVRHVGNWLRHGSTDADGRFELANCEPSVPLYLQARVRDVRSEVRLEGVLPEDGEHVLRLPKPSEVHMRGIVLDDKGEPLPNVAVWVADRSGSRRTTNDVETGAFAFGPYQAGDYKVWIRAEGFAPFQTNYRSLADGETWDLGELRMQRGGTVRFALIGQQAFVERFVSIRAKDGSYQDSWKTEGGIGRAGPLAVGEYHMQIEGPDVIAEIVPFVIREARETQIDVQLRTGTKVTLRCEAGVGTPIPVGAQLHLSTADGVKLLRKEIWHREGQDLTYELMLLPGKYRVEATTAEHEVPARTSSVEFEVASQAVTQRIEWQ